MAVARRLSFSSCVSSPSSSSSSSSSSSFSSSSSSSSSSSGRGRAIAASVAGSKPFIPSLRSSSSSWSKNDIGGDRFIPVRLPGSARYLPITKKSAADHDAAAAAAAAASSPSPSRLAYRRALADATLPDRVLAFRARPLTRPGPLEEEAQLHPVALLPTQQRTTRWRIPKAWSRKLGIPDLEDDFFLNLLDWGSANVLAVALHDTVHLWDDSNKSASELAYFSCPVTSLCWAPDGRRIAVGLHSSQVQLWNSTSDRLLTTLSGVHGGGRVTSLAWKDDNILATGGFDGDIRLHDLRLDSPVVQTFSGHTGEVCGLKWSGSTQQLASGGDDNLLHIWDVSMAAPRRNDDQTPWLYRLGDHTSAVKALAWCPFQSNLLASGGGNDDRCIKFWNTSTGCLLNSVDTASQVCSLQWSRHGRQLISSHGGPHNQLAIWKYPSMAKAAELTGHSSRVLFTAQSPDGYTLVSASADESLMFWQFSGDSLAPKPKVPKSNTGLFSNCSFSHIR